MAKRNSDQAEGGFFPFDLLGDPVPRNKGRKGRPAHVPNDGNRRVLVLAFAMGKTLAQAASMIGVTIPTLRQHYFSEVSRRSSARDRTEGFILARLAQAADDGNVAAMKALDKRLDRAVLGLQPELVKAKGKKAKPIGKKEEQKRQAYTAAEGTSWDELTQH